MAETGPLRYETPDRKYLSRFDLSLRMEPGARLELWLRYDGAGDWQRAAVLEHSGAGSVTLPIRPRRCEQLELRLTGRGEAKIFALTQDPGDGQRHV